MPEMLQLAALTVYGVMTAILMSNLYYLRRSTSDSPSTELPSVSVLIPARNEAPNLEDLIPQLLEQDYPDFEVIVYDDESEDHTRAVLDRMGDARLATITGSGPPPGWLGKTNALYESAQRASGSVYVFLDADARLLRRDSLRELVRRFTSGPARSALTVIPDLSEGGGGLVVSLAPHSLLLTIPWFLVGRLRFSSLGALNGQCWLIGAEAYHALEPHHAVKSEILEDVQIGRLLIRSGYRPCIASARDLITVRMYRTFGETWGGFRKNAYLIMGGSPVAFLGVSTAFMAVFLLAPALYPVLLIWQICLKAVTDRVAGYNPGTSVFAPLSYLLGWIIAWDSFIHHLRGNVSWKGRKVVTG